MAPAPVVDGLEPGSELAVGPHKLRCIEVLGSGSYSVVWKAQVIGSTDMQDANRQLERGEVALKDVHCKNHAALRQSLFEVQLLLALERKALLHAGSGDVRIPRCFSYTVDSQQDGWRVRTAMSCLPGEQLEAWLQRRAQDAASRSASSGQSWNSHLRLGCAMAECLIRQLGPTLEMLAPLAWHRDINSHNVLVSDPPGSPTPNGNYRPMASYWLCDLGLAVDSESWVSDQGAWRVTDIGGDCRYWPASSWMVHCYGADYLESRQDFCRQYQTRLDIHGLGITAIEVICSVALAARCAGAPAGADGPGGAQCWSWLLDSWDRFYGAVSHWWDTIYQVFSGGGDFRPVHEWLVQEAVSEQVASLMADLRAALRACAADCGEREPAAARLLRVVADLTDEASRLELGEACALLEASEAHPSSPPRPTSPCTNGSMPASPSLADAGSGRGPLPRASVVSKSPPRAVNAELPQQVAAAQRTASEAARQGRMLSLAAAASQECQRVLTGLAPIPACAQPGSAGALGRRQGGPQEVAELERARASLLADLEQLRLVRLGLEKATGRR